LAAKPRRIKTTERPIEKLIALSKTPFLTVSLLFLISVTVVPAIYAKYGGSIGKTQGDRKLSIPANKQSIALKIIDEENKSIPNIRLYIVWLERIPVIQLLKAFDWSDHQR
jgi:hypothetical protein